MVSSKSDQSSTVLPIPPASSALDDQLSTPLFERAASSLSNGDVGENSQKMAQVNGYMREQSPISPQEMQRMNTSRVASLTRTGTSVTGFWSVSTEHTAALSPDQSPSSEHGAWSSAVGHASTGKSGRVIERLQGDIDRLHREKQLLKMRHDEMEKANETLIARNQYLQDRNSNYEQSHEASSRQLARKDRQLDELREELTREKERTSRAEEQARSASMTEEQWRDEASQAKAVAQQKESEYDVIVSCRNMDNDRHQNGLDKIRSNFEVLMRQREDDLEKQKKLEIITEQQRQTIAQLEELTRKLTTNFKAYRTEIDTAVSDLRNGAEGNNTALQQKLDEMVETTGKMRWVMNVDGLFNGNPRASQLPPQGLEKRQKDVEEEPPPASPAKSPNRSSRKFMKKSKSGQ